ncbi:hypothetical protein TAL182_CH00890 [Rhizobium sp. TAL182]|nr:hypothetical protein TAL182_CH00890 [Rhizobium sp. TAL182]
MTAVSASHHSRRSRVGRLFRFGPFANKSSVIIEKFSVFSTGTNRRTAHFPFEPARQG